MRRIQVRAWRLLPSATLLVFALLISLGGAGASGSSTLPCQHGCDVALGTYRGTNDQGKEVIVHVSASFLDFGSHKEGAHIISHFKTDFVATCSNGVKGNVYINTTQRGTINGHWGHMYLGEKYMQLLWTKGEPAQGEVRYKSPTCSANTHFKLHHVA
jgi:hypothetical protein